MAPRWNELDREYREQFLQARKALSFALAIIVTSEPEGNHAIGRFQRTVADTNLLIQQLDLLIPSDRFGRPLIDAEREIARIRVVENGENR
jgi:hypothetical protein